MTRLRSACIAILLAMLLGVGPLAANAATNAVLGGINGINNGTLSGGDGTGTGRVDLIAVDLALIKQARDPLTGAVLADGTNVSSGQVVTFVLFVDNITSYPASDIRLRDQINEAEFTYLTGSFETTEVPSGSTDTDIWNGTWASISEPQDVDFAAALNTSGVTNPEPDLLTFGAELSQPNPQLDIPATTLRAIRFQVEVK